MYTRNQMTVEFGFLKDYPDTIIDYEGDDETGVTIKIEALFGTATSLRINNVTRGEYIIIDDAKLTAILGSGIQKYDLITIDTTKGNKTATLTRDGENKSILNAISLSSKWIQLQKGENRFTATATEGLDNMVISVVYQNRVLGV